MLEKIILGLLLNRDLTTYEIKKAMERSISYFYSSSFGSINPAVKKLEQQGAVTCKEKIEGGRLKRIYTITKSGRDLYLQWHADPILPGRLKEDVLVRLHFMGDTPEASREGLLEGYIDELKSEKSTLEKIVNDTNLEEFPENLREQARFQLATVQFGIDYYHFAINWFTNLKENIHQQNQQS